MDYLDFIKLDIESHGNFANHKLAIACAFRRVRYDLGKAVFIL